MDILRLLLVYVCCVGLLVDMVIGDVLDLGALLLYFCLLILDWFNLGFDCAYTCRLCGL